MYISISPFSILSVFLLHMTPTLKFSSFSNWNNPYIQDQSLIKLETLEVDIGSPLSAKPYKYAQMVTITSNNPSRHYDNVSLPFFSFLYLFFQQLSPFILISILFIDFPPVLNFRKTCFVLKNIFLNKGLNTTAKSVVIAWYMHFSTYLYHVYIYIYIYI